MWADEQRLSFTIESAKIEGRTVSYPYLLDEKGEPRLESTNDFLVWFCERCDMPLPPTFAISTSHVSHQSSLFSSVERKLQSFWQF